MKEKLEKLKFALLMTFGITIYFGIFLLIMYYFGIIGVYIALFLLGVFCFYISA